MFFSKKNYDKACPTESFRRGFTLVELLVTITIFVILTGVVLFGQAKFDSSILLTNLAYDTALTIRQAQNYGINVKEFTNTTQFTPYGVHFDIDNPKSFILFADLSYMDENDTGDGLYEYNGASRDNDVDLTRCQIDKGCVNKYNIKRGNYISDLCINSEIGNNGTCGLNSLDLVFKRPDPNALIRENNISDIQTDATIILSGSDGSTRQVRVQANGLIQVGNAI